MSFCREDLAIVTFRREPLFKTLARFWLAIWGASMYRGLYGSLHLRASKWEPLRRSLHVAASMWEPSCRGLYVEASMWTLYVGSL